MKQLKQNHQIESALWHLTADEEQIREARALVRFGTIEPKHDIEMIREAARDILLAWLIGAPLESRLWTNETWECIRAFTRAEPKGSAV